MAHNTPGNSLQDILLLTPSKMLWAEAFKSMIISQLRFMYLSEQDFATFDIIVYNDLGGCVATALAYRHSTRIPYQLGSYQGENVLEALAKMWENSLKKTAPRLEQLRKDHDYGMREFV